MTLENLDHFIPTGDCTDMQTRHAEALAAALSGLKDVANLISNMQESQSNVCEILKDMRKELKIVAEKLHSGREDFIAVKKDVDELKKDLNGIGQLSRGHIDKHPVCADIQGFKDHMAWHKTQEEGKKKWWDDNVTGTLVKALIGFLLMLLAAGFITWSQKNAAISAASEVMQLMKEKK